MNAVERLIAEAVAQGFAERVENPSALHAVAAIVKVSTKKAVNRERAAA